MGRKIILIGGMPTAGKSTIAEGVAKHFNLPWISTDQIRTIMKSVADRTVYPELFNAADYSAEEFLNKFSAQEIANMEFRQGSEAWIGIRELIDNDWTWRNGVVIEGVNILPTDVKEAYGANPDVTAVFLSDNDRKRVAQVVYNRGLFDDANKYSDSVKEKEVEWALLLDTMLKSEAVKAGYPVVSITKTPSDIQNVIDVISLAR
jgi:2-phosphoglycerate kinase